MNKQHYEICWYKVQSLDDVKRLLAELRITFSPDYSGLRNIIDLVELHSLETDDER